MRKKIAGFGVSIMLGVLCANVQAQQPGKVHRIGMLVSGSVATHGNRVDALRQGLRDLGYVEGKNLGFSTIVYSDTQVEEYSAIFRFQVMIGCFLVEQH